MKIIRRANRELSTKVVAVPTYDDMVRFESLSSVKKNTMFVKDLFDKAREMSSRCYDMKFNIKEMDMHLSEGIMSMSSGTVEGRFSSHALSQLFSRFGIPNSYASFCMKNKAYGLLQDNLSHWVDKFGGDFLFRFFKDYDGTDIVRAFLTEKYKAFDTLDIMNVARSNIDLNRNYSVRSYTMNPERLHIRLVSDEAMKVSGEDLFMGVTIDSSDVGRSSLRMSIIVYKQVCTNGLVLPAGISRVYRQIHFGAGADKFNESITACLSAVGQIKHTAEEIIVNSSKKDLPFDRDSEDSVEKFRVAHKLSKPVMEDSLKLLDSNVYGKPTLWTFINCLTESAQKVTLDSRLEVEKEAGRLLLIA